MKDKLEGCSGAVMVPRLPHLHPQDAPHLCPATPMPPTLPVPHRLHSQKCHTYEAEPILNQEPSVFRAFFAPENEQASFPQITPQVSESN